MQSELYPKQDIKLKTSKGWQVYSCPNPADKQNQIKEKGTCNSKVITRNPKLLPSSSQTISQKTHGEHELQTCSALLAHK